MTNKPMLSADRELLEEMLAAMKETHSLPANFYGSTLGDRVRVILESQNEQAEPLAIGTLHRDCDERIVFESSGEVHIKDGMQVYAEPAAQHQGEPVAWVECSPAWLKAGGDCATAPRICVGREGISHLHPAHSNAEQPEPVADQAQCEECKGWGYHENHHEGGGTECGECGGSGNATVAVVIPDHTMRSVMDAIQQARGFPVLTSNQCHALAESLNYVARLNGVKP